MITTSSPDLSLGYALAQAVWSTGEPPRLTLRAPYEIPLPSALDDLAELIDELTEDARRHHENCQWPQSMSRQMAWHRGRSEAVESTGPLLDDAIRALSEAGCAVELRRNCSGPFTTQLVIEML